jgi:16S rRNA (cytidine1402-2'-O)-methyltransferase
MSKGVLYVVATPIGNLADLSERAQETLKQVNWIAAEDTRQTEKLCQRFQINTRKMAYHQHNESAASKGLLKRLLDGESIALVSDAGTPLISDPGFCLVQAAHDADITVIPIPGPCSAITLLSASGLSATRFSFFGFLPAKPSARRSALRELSGGQTVIFFESPNRMKASLEDMIETFGPETAACLGRELTKRFEQIVRASLPELKERIENGEIPEKGEFAVCVELPPQSEDDSEAISRYLSVLLEHLGPKSASECVSALLDCPKNKAYKIALSLKNGN